MNENKDILDVCAETFLAMPFVDTSIALRVRGAKGCFNAVSDKLAVLYGSDARLVFDGKSAVLSEVSDADVVEAPALPDFDKPRYNAADAARVIARLMRPNDGCPWDRVQTHDSIRVNMIEEAYEAVDAIDKRDIDNMKEEFGDVFLQSLLQSAIAKRDGKFDFDDVCDGLCKKLIGRHSFIFGGDSASDASDALTLWDKNKTVEKHYNSVKQQLETLPDAFPALLRCQKAYKKIKKNGYVVDPQSELSTALDSGDYAEAIAACVGLLAENGKDAEVELNRVVRDRISEL